MQEALHVLVVSQWMHFLMLSKETCVSSWNQTNNLVSHCNMEPLKVLIEKLFKKKLGLSFYNRAVLAAVTYLALGQLLTWVENLT